MKEELNTINGELLVRTPKIQNREKILFRKFGLLKTILVTQL